MTPVSGITSNSISQPQSVFVKKPQGPWEKTAQAVKKFFIFTMVIGITILGNILTLGIPSFIRLYSYIKTTDVKEKIEGVRIAHLHSALEIPLGTPTPQNKDEKYFFEEVAKLREQVAGLEAKRLQGKISLGSVEAVYEKLQELGKEAKFIEVFEALSNDPHAQFLKTLSAKFRSAQMSQVLIEHAREKFGDIEPDLENGYSIGKTAEAITHYRKESSFRQNFFWAISHPANWFHSCESKWLQEEYDNNASNPTYSVHETECEGIPVRFIAGPTPFNDAAFQNFFLKEGHELRFDIMDTSKKGEHGWIQKIDQAAARSNGHLEHVVLGFVTKKKRGYLKPTTLKGLIGGYEKALLEKNGCRSIGDRKNDNGALIPEHLLSDEEIRSACYHAKALIEELNPDLSTEASRHAVLLTVDTMIALGAMTRYLAKEKEKTGVNIGVSCKQCYDRGPVYLAALLLFQRSLTNPGPLSRDEFYKLAGLPIFRAPLSEGREQQKEKFAVYEAFANMIGKNTDVLSKHTQNFRATLE